MLLLFQETLWEATIDLVRGYLRQSEEDPERVLQALERAEGTSTDAIHSQFSLKVRVLVLIGHRFQNR